MNGIERNDRCPCGSGKKYKHCHLGREIMIQHSGYYHEMSGISFNDSGNRLNLYERNKALIEGMIDIFSLDGAKSLDWSEIKRTISREHIKEFYKLIAWLWPPNTPIWEMIPKPENKLRSLYLGYMRPETVLQSVVRYSLYCDEILVINPFVNPWYITEEHNPLVHPEDYLADTIKWMFFLLQLAPWIVGGQVILLPDIGNFDPQLRKDTWKMAESRIGTMSDEAKDSILNDPQFEKIREEDFQRMWLATPTDAMRRKIKEQDPKMTDEEVADLLTYIQKMKDNDPYYPTNPNEQGTFGLHLSSFGANLEMGIFLAQATGAYMYTDFDFRWKEILSTSRESTLGRDWSPITYGFQQLDFKFLDKTTPLFANRIKKEGRLANMRNFLRKTWVSIASEPDNKKVNEIALTFTDELKEEYGKAEIEWQKIDTDLATWVLSEGGIGGVISAGMDWRAPALGFVVGAVGKLLHSRFDRKRFSANVPLSVFVDLNRGQRK